MMGSSYQYYIQSFVKIGPPVLEKTVEGFVFIYGRGGHLGHLTEILQTNFNVTTQGGFTKSFNLIGKAVLEKNIFEIVT